MYMVVSKWEVLPSREGEFEDRGQAVREVLRKQPGVNMLEVFLTDNGAVAIVGYENEDTYHKIVDDPNGPFARAVTEHNLEEVSHWVWSERGETIQD